VGAQRWIAKRARIPRRSNSVCQGNLASSRLGCQRHISEPKRFAQEIDDLDRPSALRWGMTKPRQGVRSVWSERLIAARLGVALFSVPGAVFRTPARPVLRFGFIRL